MKRESGLWSMVTSHIPLVFTTAGGIGPDANSFYKRLSSMLSDKH